MTRFVTAIAGGGKRGCSGWVVCRMHVCMRDVDEVHMIGVTTFLVQSQAIK